MIPLKSHLFGNFPWLILFIFIRLFELSDNCMQVMLRFNTMSVGIVDIIIHSISSLWRHWLRYNMIMKYRYLSFRQLFANVTNSRKNFNVWETISLALHMSLIESPRKKSTFETHTLKDNNLKVTSNHRINIWKYFNLMENNNKYN